MSWSLSNIQTDPGDNFEDVIQSAYPTGFNELDDHVKEAVVQAKDAATTLVHSRVFGDPEEVGFTINLAGHSNPGHLPADGWANDFVSISVSQKTVE